MESHKQEFLRKFNQAFVDQDTQFILDSVSDNIHWSMVGADTVYGKEAFARVLENLKNDNLHRLEIHHVITHGKEGAVDGIVTEISPAGVEKRFAFCDIYVFEDEEGAKIKEMHSYGVDVSPNPASG